MGGRQGPRLMGEDAIELIELLKLDRGLGKTVKPERVPSESNELGGVDVLEELTMMASGSH